jgi:hypothetical protein
MHMKRFEDVRDDLEETILQIEKSANDLKCLADVIEDELYFRLHDTIESFELSIKTR